jgi:hypothetical protein
MANSGRFFRRIWRVNAILILVAAGAIVLGVVTLLIAEFGAGTARREAAATGPVVGGAEGGRNLVLNRAAVVAGTNVMRADLVVRRGGEGFSSGGYDETRNVLFVEPGEKAARWLLPDHDHVIAETYDVVRPREDERSGGGATVATVVLVKQRAAPFETVRGRLLLCDPSGRHVVEVSASVRTVHATTLSGTDLNILYERDRNLVLTTFDAASLDKRREQQVDVPQLK